MLHYKPFALHFSLTRRDTIQVFLLKVIMQRKLPSYPFFLRSRHIISCLYSDFAGRCSGFETTLLEQVGVMELNELLTQRFSLKEWCRSHKQLSMFHCLEERKYLVLICHKPSIKLD